MNQNEIWNHRPLIFDGAMGTYYTSVTGETRRSCEEANVLHPEVILDIHREYIAAGADAITSNTFGIDRSLSARAEATVLLEAGWKLACRAAEGTSCMVFAGIGPTFRSAAAEDVTEELTWTADQFLALGAKQFLFETQSSLTGLAETAAHIKEKEPESFILINFAVQAGGFTAEGLYAGDIVRQMASCSSVDAVGFNCGSSAGHLLETIRVLHEKNLVQGKPICVMPNAGYPVVVNNRTFYEGDPYYFASRIRDMVEQGVSIVGGCCGTTPAHIREIRTVLEAPARSQEVKVQEAAPRRINTEPESAFWNKLQNGERVIAVELDPPADVDLDKFLAGIDTLKAAHADIITIADCPIGRARMDSSLLACKVYREKGIEALPHMTCRDRNLNATKALLLGLYAEGIRNVLMVTGDPVPTAQRDEVKSVYQFNSRKLARFATSLNEILFPTPLHLFGALNVNARNFENQLKSAREKEQEGMKGFLTQPVLSEQAFENLKLARKELSGFLLGGIIPIVSERNALFMDSEINGINVDPELIKLYAGKDREESEELAVRISTDIARRIRDYTDGYYFMTPFLRAGLIARIIEHCATEAEHQ